MLELKNIKKDYRVADNEVPVLKGISLTFRDCELVSILGPSGCGKTTMLNIIGGLDRATSGDLIINGRPTLEYSDRDWDTYRNHEIGFVFQSYNLIPHQTVLKNVELALSIGGIPAKERRQRALFALAKVGLQDHVDKKPNQLSGGQCQRVSIARALVNDPNIILADEPTGALDSETSVQVMDILKEIAKDRLVIMVTHNADLANAYSTRIVRMLDGRITEDSAPVSEIEREELSALAKSKQEGLSEEDKKRQARKSSMSLWSSLALSWSNLGTKKKRTFITSLACSIGIIGIAVILSVSTGMNSYVNKLQQDSSSSSYISISSTAIGAIDFSTDEGETGLTEYPSGTTGVYPYSETAGGTSNKSQILSDDYIDYLETNINGDAEDTDLVLGISYARDIDINVLTLDSAGEYSVVDASYFSEMLDNSEYLGTQYTILAGDGLPSGMDEVSIVVDSYNRLSTKILDSLGIAYDDDLSEIPYSSFVGREFKAIPNDSFYFASSGIGDGERDVYSTIKTQEAMSNAYVDSGSVTLKVVSVIRQNEDASSDWVGCGIAYSPSLTDMIISLNADSTVVSYQKENPEYDVLTGKLFADEATGSGVLSALLGVSGNSYDGNLVSLGAVSTPSSITIYPKDFDSKDRIISVLDSWNETEIYKLYGNEKDQDGNYVAEQYRVEYTDISALMVSMLGSLINIVTYVLIAFSAVSLVVSSIMIAIITYASVVERIKEIGVIRSLGGRKGDVSRLFIAEACIIGAFSAIIALAVTLLIDALVNLILGSLVGVSTIASLSVSTAFWMVVLSVGLNLIASLIPASIAAKKDPVVALRTE